MSYPDYTSPFAYDQGNRILTRRMSVKVPQQYGFEGVAKGGAHGGSSTTAFVLVFRQAAT